MRSRKYVLLRFLMMTFLVFCSSSEIHATLPEGPELPQAASHEIVTLEATGGKPGGRFEYDVTFTALLDLEKVELFFGKPDAVVFDAEPEPFRGSMKAGEVKKWKLKGSITGMVQFKDGTTLHPPIRFEGSYLYPYEAVRQEIIRRFQKGEGVRFAMNQDHALREMEYQQMKGKTVKVFEGWLA